MPALAAATDAGHLAVCARTAFHAYYCHAQTVRQWTHCLPKSPGQHLDDHGGSMQRA